MVKVSKVCTTDTLRNNILFKLYTEGSGRKVASHFFCAYTIQYISTYHKNYIHLAEKKDRSKPRKLFENGFKSICYHF